MSNSNGEPTERYNYDVFGEPTFKDGDGNSVANSTSGNQLLFAGREWLMNAKLYDYRHRAYSTGAAIHAPPILDGSGTIFVGSGDRNFYAFNQNGTIRWKCYIGYGVPYSASLANDGTIYIPADGIFAVKSDGSLMRKIDAANSLTASSPAIAKDGKVFVNGSGKVLAYRSDGELLWEKTNTLADSRIAPSIGLDGTLYANGDGPDRTGSTIVAFRPDGTKRWTFDTDDLVLGGVALGADGTLYFGGVHKILYAVDASGRERWRFTAGGGIEFTPIVGEDGTIYFGASDGKLYALGPNGTLKWTFTTPGQVACSPAVDRDGTIYFTSAGNPGSLNAVDAKGQLLWSATGTPNARTRINFKGTGSPVLGPDGTLYLGDGNGSLYAFAVNAGPAGSSWPMIRHDAAGSGRTE